MADFNGVTLPDLPLVDRSTYPYAIIASAVGLYQVLFLTQPIYYDSTESRYKILSGTTSQAYSASPSSSTWADAGTSTEQSDNYIDEGIYIIWSDHDIVDTNTEEVVFPSSLKKFYYNGVLLPEIPEVDGHSIAGMVRIATTTETRYALMLASKSFYVTTDADNASVAYLHPIEDLSTYGYYYVDGMSTIWTSGGNSNHSKDAIMLPLGDFETEGVYEFIWTNTNIPNGSADATDIYMYATYPHETYWYYNGMKLPNIPTKILEQCPYMIAVRIKITIGIGYGEPVFMSGYMVMLSEKKFYIADVEQEGNVYPTVFAQSGNIMTFNTEIEKFSNEFVNEGGQVSPSDGVAQLMPIIPSETDTMKMECILWCANHDVPYGSADATEYYLKANEKPLYYEDSEFAVKASDLVNAGNEIRRIIGSEEPMTFEEMVTALQGVATVSTTSTE